MGRDAMLTAREREGGGSRVCLCAHSFWFSKRLRLGLFQSVCILVSFKQHFLKKKKLHSTNPRVLIYSTLLRHSCLSVRWVALRAQTKKIHNKSNVPLVFTGLAPNVLQYIIWYIHIPSAISSLMSHVALRARAPAVLGGMCFRRYWADVLARTPLRLSYFVLLFVSSESQNDNIIRKKQRYLHYEFLEAHISGVIIFPLMQSHGLTHGSYSNCRDLAEPNLTPHPQKKAPFAHDEWQHGLFYRQILTTDPGGSWGDAKLSFVNEPGNLCRADTGPRHRGLQATRSTFLLQSICSEFETFSQTR